MHSKIAIAAISAGCFALVLGANPVHAAPPDACKLLSVAQITAVLGIKTGEGQHSSPSNNRFCKWDAPAPAGKPRKGVALRLESPSHASTKTATRAAHRIVETTSAQSAKVPADGFRGDSYYMTMLEVGGVKIPEDRSVLQIRVYGFPVNQVKTKEKILSDCVQETLTNGRFQGGCPL